MLRRALQLGSITRTRSSRLTRAISVRPPKPTPQTAPVARADREAWSCTSLCKSLLFFTPKGDLPTRTPRAMGASTAAKYRARLGVHCDLAHADPR
jgi:hypothetical protein